MRYIKLFEQEEWWLDSKEINKNIDPVNIDGLCLVVRNDYHFYIAEKIVNDHIYMYKNCPRDKDFILGKVEWVPLMGFSSTWALVKKEDLKENSKISYYDVMWRHLIYKNLPQEIKDKLK